jgi:IS5 family transposase
MLVIKHLCGWRFPQTTHAVSDSLVLRQLCRVYVAPVSDQSTLPRWAKLLQPATLHRLLDHLVHLACQLKVTQGRKLRLDGTVVATTIHHPTDSTLWSRLWRSPGSGARRPLSGSKRPIVPSLT